MKFGKSIRAEARNNRGLSFINFKYLKRILKRCGAAVRAGTWDVAREEDRQFCSILESELRKVGESYWKELQQISQLQALITQKLPLLDIQPDPQTYTRMGFDQLQSHLQSLGGLNEVPSCGDCLASSVKTSAALCEFCVNLGKISARCKRLRRCVLWNAVAVVKILKKRQKHTTLASNGEVAAVQWEESHRETAVEVLARQDWYCCDQLPKIVSIVETTTDELMQRLTLKPPNRDQYQCPICLDVVVDPVCLRTCGHRFCWACLCMAYCEKPEGTLERCPCCRAAFPLDPEAFEVDGILSRFLRDFFPEDQSAREKEQKENLRQRLEGVQRQQEQHLSTMIDDQPPQEEQEMSSSSSSSASGCAAEDAEHHHCCPDCVVDGEEQDSMTPTTDSITLGGCSSECSTTTDQQLSGTLFESLAKLSALQHAPPTLNGPLIRSAAKWLKSTPDHQPGTSMNKKHSSKGCRHELNVKLGKPSDVDRLAFTSSSSSQGPSSAASSPSFTFSPQLPTSSGQASTSELSSTSITMMLAPSSPSHTSISHSRILRSIPSTASCLSYASSCTSHAPTLPSDQETRVVDSVVASLLCETPPRHPSPPPHFFSSSAKDVESSSGQHHRQSSLDFLLPEMSSVFSSSNVCSLNSPTATSQPYSSNNSSSGTNTMNTTTVVEEFGDFLSDSFLPTNGSSTSWMAAVIMNHNDFEGVNSSSNAISEFEFYEALDSEDDRIEEEYLSQQRQQQQHHHHHTESSSISSTSNLSLPNTRWMTAATTTTTPISSSATPLLIPTTQPLKVL